jgi:hypothetical protein
MDEGTPLGGLESEDNAEPSHGLHTIFSSLWGRGHLAHRLRIRFPEGEGVRRQKRSNQPRRLTGPAGRGSGHGLTTLGAVLAVPATAVHHRQGFEAWDIQAGQQSRRGLQQRLEHPTATSLLPLRCFQVVRTPRSHTKSNHQGRVSLASTKPDPPSGARRGAPPPRQNFPRKRSFCQNIFRAFRLLQKWDPENNGVHVRNQGRPSRGTPTPPGYGYLTHHLLR